MGALCGKESHFSELSGGHSLTRTQTNTAPPLAKPSKPPVARPLGGNGPAPAEEAERREAILRAAEARSQSVSLNKSMRASKKGVPHAGKLSAQLAAQKADGGRVEEAVRDGSNRQQPLVYD
ncbi:hypothetical protein P7C70_g6027, partial [Phenoliferia sp. Uapishka_3]